MAKVNDKSKYHTAMMTRWAKWRAVSGGTDTMRSAKEAYLPRHEQETEKGYSARLARSTFHNFTMRTVRHMVGVAFGEDPVLSDDTPDEMKDWLKDADLDGHNLASFLQNPYGSAIGMGEVYILATMDDGETENVTAADGRRPYMQMIEADSMLAFHQSTKAGVPYIEHARVLSSHTERNGFAEIEVEQIKVFEPGTVNVWERRGGAGEFVRVSTTSIDFDGVPITRIRSVEASADGLLRPMLTDLVDKNIEHWQSASDQRNILTMSRFPMLYGVGLDKNAYEAIRESGIGPQTLLTSTNKDASFGYVEPVGGAISAGRQDLQDLKEEMAELASRPFMQQTGDVKATTHAIARADEDSQIKTFSNTFGDSVSAALDDMAEWGSINPEKIDLTMLTEFGGNEIDSSTLDALHKARAQGDISRETYLGALVEHGVLASDFDAKKNLAELDSEVEDVDDDDIDDPEVPPK